MNANIFTQARRAMAFFPMATPKQRASQATKYARSVVLLGDKWILNTRVERKAA